MTSTGKLFGIIGQPARTCPAHRAQAAAPSGYAQLMARSYEASRIRRASAALARLVVDPLYSTAVAA